MKKDFLSITDLPKEQILDLLDVAALQKRGITSDVLKNKKIALYFEKPSLRTKASFEVGIQELGGEFSYFSTDEVGKMGERESVDDFAHVLSGYFDAIVARVYDHVNLAKFAGTASIPVINALSDHEHPCQILADLLTIREKLGRLDKFKLAYLGDGNNVALSLALAAEILDFEFILAGPKKYQLGYSQIKQTENLDEALDEADVIYTDTWNSMGEPKKSDETILTPFQLNAAALQKAKPKAIVLHCLPAHRGQEITDEVLDGPQSAVFEQAANRLPAQKSLLIKLFAKGS
ncbi:MAG: ornithine carbamoyltransferase [Patescibacteria group bacterium]